MALAQDDTTAPDTPFTWGAGGGRMTPESIAARRKVADALALQASDYSPIRSPWQGVARVAQGLSSGLQMGAANRAEQANADENKQMIAALLARGSGATPAATPAAVPAPVADASVPVASPAPVAVSAAPPATTAAGDKIYSNDEPSPLDEPTGADRDAMIRTVYGEAGNEPTAGQTAVAAVIRNRAVDGGYGGDTPSAVVHEPNQFEPWNGGPAKDRMLALSPTDPKYQAISKVVDAAYGTGGRAPADPTDGATLFYSPKAQAALGRPAPTWAKGEGTVIGNHTFYDDTDPATPAKPVQVASADPAAIPVNAAPTQGYAIPGRTPPVVAPTAAPTPGVTKVAGAMGGVDPAVIQAMTSPYASDATKKIAGLVLTQQMTPKDVHTQETDASGNIWDVNHQTGQRTIALKKEPEDKPPASVAEYKYYKDNLPAGATAMPYDVWSTAKARAAATNINQPINVDMNSAQTYDKQLAEGLGKAHAGLANGVEDSQARARDIAAMQGAVDAIQKNGGTTGGLAPQTRLEIQKSINAGASALGIDKPFDESDLSDKEFLTKFNRSMAGAQAKNAVGSRVTNFEMSNFLKANPGLDMTITGNQRLLGIQGQIEQRNIAVGNAIRDATAQAISKGAKIDPVTVQGIITSYDQAHHIQDPTTGQDLTQSYALPEFQKPDQGTNAGLAVQHDTNMGPTEKTIGGKTYVKQGAHWYEKP